MALEWLPLVTTPAGALIGGYAGYHLSRSRLNVTIDRIRIVPSQSVTTLPVSVNTQLQQAASEFPKRLPSIVGITAPERTYVAFLELLRDTVEDEDRSLQKAEDVSTSLRQLAATEEFEQLISIYKFQHRTLWPWASGEASRGHNFFSGPDKQPSLSQQQHPLHEISIEDGAALLVTLPGVQQMLFDWDTSVPEPWWKAVEQAARRAATAFAYHVRDDLMEYFGGLRAVISDAREALRGIQRQVHEELERHARLQVDFLVSNTGRAGVSVSAEALVTVFLKGYIAANSPVQNDLDIALDVMSESRASDLRREARDSRRDEFRAEEFAPIVIEGGTTLRLVGTSRRLLSGYPSSDALRAAYSGAERHMTLRLARYHQSRLFWLRRNRDSIRSLASKKVLFRDLRFTSAVD